MLSLNAFHGKSSLALIVPACLVMAAGCNKGASDGSAGSGTVSNSGAGTGTASAAMPGKAVYDTNNCSRCHAIGGQGGTKAPDLTTAGAEAAHDVDWFIVQVKNPRDHNPGSKMPAFQGRINDADLKALGAYLASLK